MKVHNTGKLGKYGLFLFGVAVVCFGAYSFQVMKQPLPWLISVVPDDAFYYLQIARHLADSGVSTFDGSTVTNGYHPGWMAVLTVLAKFVPDRVMLLRIGLLTALLLHLLTSLLLVRLLQWHMSRFRAWVGGAFWLLNPLALTLATQVMETPLYLLAITCVVIVFQERLAFHARPGQPFLPPRRDLLLFGISLSFAVWARTEAIILASLCPIVVAVLIRFHTHARSFLSNWARAIALTGISFLVCLLPWFIFSWLATGHVRQDSGAMKMLWAQHLYATLGWGGRLMAGVHYLKNFWYGSTLGLLLGLPNSWVPLLQMGLLAGMWLAVLHLWRRGARERLFMLTSGWLLATSLATGIVFGLFLTGSSQVWYQGNPGWVLYVVCAGAACLILPVGNSDRSRWLEMASGSAVTLIAVLLCGSVWLNPPVHYPWQRDIYASQQRFEAMIPANARIGCFNAGVAAYFSSRQVFNLDGLVNGKAYRYWKTRTFDQYLQADHIAYVIDDEGAVDRTRYFSSARLHLVPLASHPLTGWVSLKRYLWRVEPGSGSAQK